MFRWGNKNRGIPTKDGIYCQLHNKIFSSEAELEPRQSRNRSTEVNFMSNRGCGRRMWHRSLGRGWGLGRVWFGCGRGRMF